MRSDTLSGWKYVKQNGDMENIVAIVPQFVDIQVIGVALILEECWNDEHISRIVKRDRGQDDRLNGNITGGMWAPNSCD